MHWGGLRKKSFFAQNGRKTTFEWPKVVSEVIFPRFWGVVCIEKCFQNFEIVVGSAVPEISRFGPFYVKSPQWRICAVRDSVYAHTVLINDFNRLGSYSTFHRTWLCKNL